jgi:hypothetical protein
MILKVGNIVRRILEDIIFGNEIKVEEQELSVFSRIHP